MAMQKELEDLINKYSRENKSDTPDFILANYLMDCLSAFEQAVVQRTKWYGHIDWSKEELEITSGNRIERRLTDV